MEDLQFEFKKVTSDGNCGRFSELMFACFGKKTDEAYFRWKYFNNPAGSLIAYEALYDGKTVGFYGIIPEFYVIDGKLEKVYQSMDTMTHPKFQRKGLFVKLAQMTYLTALQEESKLIIVGFPGAQSYEGFVNKLNWVTIQKCRYIFVPRALFSLKNMALRQRGTSIQKYLTLTPDLSEYLTRYITHTKVSKFFDQRIFQWKVFDNPNYKYEVIGLYENGQVIGVCLYRVEGEKTCEISWIHFVSDEKYEKYLALAVRYIFDETRVRYIYSWVPPSRVLARAYKQAGFITNTLSKGPFNEEFPLIVYVDGYSQDPSIKNFDNYDFQPILLD